MRMPELPATRADLSPAGVGLAKAGRGQARRADTGHAEPGSAAGSGDDHRAVRGAWRQPVVWLALLIFVATLAACIAMIVLAVRITDPADAHAAGQTIMKMPLERLPEASRPLR